MPVEHDVTEAAVVAAGVVSDEVVEAVVSDAAAGGVDLLGPDGVLAELTKRILERALAEEMTDLWAMSPVIRWVMGRVTTVTGPLPNRC